MVIGAQESLPNTGPGETPVSRAELTYDLHVIPRRNLFAAGVLLLVGAILTVSTHDYTTLVVGVAAFAVIGLLLWTELVGPTEAALRGHSGTLAQPSDLGSVGV
jgi:hypothetical protein